MRSLSSSGARILRAFLCAMFIPPHAHELTRCDHVDLFIQEIGVEQEVTCSVRDQVLTPTGKRRFHDHVGVLISWVRSPSTTYARVDDDKHDSMIAYLPANPTDPPAMGSPPSTGVTTAR